MTGWSFGSTVYGGAWSTPQMRALFDDAARTRRWIDLLVVLAEVQAEHGVIPAEAARQIADACASLVVDAAFLEECRAGYESTAHSTMGLIGAVARRAGPLGAQWFYFGATVQDIADSWLMLTLRDARALLIADLDRAIAACAMQCRRHRDTLAPGRTHGQQGLPITFGFKAAGWLAEMRRHRARVDEAAARMDIGQLAGGVGTLSALGPRALDVQARFFARIGLRVPDMSWTASRDILVEWAQLLALVGGTADRIGHEIYNLQRDEIGEVREPALAQGVGSITMPHKRNPETAEHIGTLARVVRANAALLSESVVHDHERDGRAWKVEWHAVPELTMAAGKALALLAALLDGLEIDAARMRANLMASGGFALSEGLMLALAPHVGKQAAHKMIQALAEKARRDGLSFPEAARGDAAIVAKLGAGEIERLLDPRAQIGHCQGLIDRLLGAQS